jgi:heptosyltransferase-1
VRIALIKTSSMGDVIHAFPVVTDIVAALPGAEIDWVVEASFADLPALHPAVRTVIPVAVRRWRRALLRGETWSEVRAARVRLRERRYDLALDLQGLIKSALVARWTGAPIAGFSRGCAREPLAAMAYARTFDVDMQAHAIERLRSLAGQALGYPVQGLPRFGLRPPAPAIDGFTDVRPVVFLHATSRAQKQWPAEHWVDLGRRLAAVRTPVLVPWGSDAEREAAVRIAQGIGGSAQVAPKLTLAQCARMLGDATAVVGVDTGLTHLAAALEVPTVALFAATPAWRFGPYWTEKARSLGADGVWPGVDEVVQALADLAGISAPGGEGSP